MEKFRPYALPDASWLEHVTKSLAKRPTRSTIHAGGNGAATA
jgi:hypothetical protein